MSANIQQDQIALERAEIIASARAALERLRAFKEQIGSKLDTLEVTYIPEENPEISEAIIQIFGQHKDSSTESGKKAITVEMFTSCIAILKQTGLFKGTSLFEGVL